MDQAMIAAGIGCKRGAPACDIEGAIRAALLRTDMTVDALNAIATIEAKSAEAGIRAAARALGIAVVIVPERELLAAGARVETQSERVLALAGVGSVAEAAALAAAGPSATLIATRIIVGAATCALAASPSPRAGP
jgi:cobalt-precorrin 5A hydrolase